MKNFRIYYSRKKKRKGTQSDPLYWSEIRDVSRDNYYQKRTNAIDLSSSENNTAYVVYDMKGHQSWTSGELGFYFGMCDGTNGSSNPRLSAYLESGDDWRSYVDYGTDSPSVFSIDNDISFGKADYAVNCGMDVNVEYEGNVVLKCEWDTKPSELRLYSSRFDPYPIPSSSSIEEPSSSSIEEPSSSSIEEPSSSSSSLSPDTRTVMYTVYAKMSKEVITGDGYHASNGEYVAFGGSSYNIKPLKTTSVLAGSSGYTTGPTGYQRINVSDLNTGVYQIVGYNPSTGVEIYNDGTYQCCYAYDMNGDYVMENQGNIDDFIEGFYVTYEVV